MNPFILSALSASFENIKLEQSEYISSNDDLVLFDPVEVDRELSLASDQMKEASYAFEALSNCYGYLSDLSDAMESLNKEGGLDKNGKLILKAAISNALLTLPKPYARAIELKLSPALESAKFDELSTQLEASLEAESGIKGIVSRAGIAVKEAFKKFIEFVVNLFKKITGNFESLKTYGDLLIKKAKSLKELKEDAKPVDVNKYKDVLWNGKGPINIKGVLTENASDVKIFKDTVEWMSNLLIRANGKKTVQSLLQDFDLVHNLGKLTDSKIRPITYRKDMRHKDHGLFVVELVKDSQNKFNDNRPTVSENTEHSIESLAAIVEIGTLMKETAGSIESNMAITSNQLTTLDKEMDDLEKSANPEEFKQWNKLLLAQIKSVVSSYNGLLHYSKECMVDAYGYGKANLACYK